MHVAIVKRKQCNWIITIKNYLRYFAISHQETIKECKTNLLKNADKTQRIAEKNVNDNRYRDAWSWSDIGRAVRKNVEDDVLIALKQQIV